MKIAQWLKTPIADMVARRLDFDPRDGHVLELGIEVGDAGSAEAALAVIDARGVGVLLDGAEMALPHGVAASWAIIVLTTCAQPVAVGELRALGFEYVVPGCDPRGPTTLQHRVAAEFKEAQLTPYRPTPQQAAAAERYETTLDDDYLRDGGDPEDRS